jgi:hypothetical protein
MARRAGSVYEERDYYSREDLPLRGPPVRTRERDREEIDIYTRREREPDRRPDFLRDDYGRGDAGPLVVRERETETFTRPPERRPRSPSPVRIRERIIERERSPSPAPLERVRTRVVERERSSTPPPPERLRARVIETRERVRERSPSPIRYRERVVERARSPSPIRIRERFVERERSPSPPHFERVRTRVTERETRAPSPSPSPSPPASIRAPPIHQEIITHHRHIDHGKLPSFNVINPRTHSGGGGVPANPDMKQDSSVPQSQVHPHLPQPASERLTSISTHPKTAPRST